MKENELEKGERICQKCNEKIGGKAYYLIQLDCIYDGKSLSACERLIMCSDCYSNLRTWLKLPK